MTGAFRRDVTIVTPSYLPDLDRVCLQAESIHRLGIPLRHLVIAHSEDCAAFASALRPWPSEVLPTSAAIPASFERRRAAPYRRRDLRRYVQGAPVAGWMGQQLLKLCAPGALGLDIAVYLDSEYVFTKPVSAEHFSAASRALLFESVGDDATTLSWGLEAFRSLGIDFAGKTLRQYIHHPTVMTADVLRGLQARLESLHRGHWLNSVMKSGSTEYVLHGTFAKYVMPDAVVAAPPLPHAIVWTGPESVDAARRTLIELVETNDPYVVGIQSTLGVPPDVIRELCEPFWR